MLETERGRQSQGKRRASTDGWSLLTDWMERVGCSRVEGRKWGKAGKPAVQGRQWGLENLAGPCSGIVGDGSARVTD